MSGVRRNFHWEVYKKKVSTELIAELIKGKRSSAKLKLIFSQKIGGLQIKIFSEIPGGNFADWHLSPILKNESLLLFST